MSALGRTRAWLRAVVSRGRMEREMQEEMAVHIEQAAARFRARGMSERDALLAARREFGHMGALQEEARDARGGQWVDHLARDVRYALRYFARTPLTTITIVSTLALGIGFSSAVFSVIDGILTRPAPGVPDDPALVKIRGISTVRPFDRKLSYPELSAYATLTDRFESVAGWVGAGVVVDAGDPDVGALSARALFVTPNYFRALGVRPAAGRGFSQARFDERFPPELTAVISDAFASERFGGARAAVGKQVKLNDVTVTIIGVAPPRFNGAVQSGEPRTLWLPLSAWQLVTKVSDRAFSDPAAQSFEALARLRPGVTVADALAAVRVVAARADAAAKAQARRDWTATADVVRLRGMMEVTGRYADELGPGMVLFIAIALLILLVCTTTVNSLLVGAAVARRYEIGVRLALGASRGRVVRQLLTEIAMLALAGGGLGVWVFGALSRVTEVASDGFDVSPTWATMGFTMLYALLTATLCGLSPALHATRAGVSEVLKDGSAGTRARSRLQRAFVVAQIAIAQPLMIGLAAVLAHMVSELEPKGNVTLRDRVLIAELDSHVGFALDGRDRIPALVRRLAALPSVSAVLPIGPWQSWASLQLPPSSLGNSGSRPARASAAVFEVPPGYFAAVDAPIVRGRAFVAGDTTAPVTPVIIAESLAVALFGSRDPIGQRLLRTSPYEARPAEMEVVGVVRATRETLFLEQEPDYPPVFVPFRRRPEGLCQRGACIGVTKLLIRTVGPAEPLIPTVMAVAREEARMLPLTRIETLAQGDRRWRRSRAELVGVGAVCGAVALVLASIGLYGMVSIAVGQRRREIGVRIALGAHVRQVVRMFLASGLRATLLGLALGVPVSVAALVALMRMLDVRGDRVPALAALVTLAVVGVASLASWLPARRAARVDPVVALRSE
jgi:predicted permease